MYGSDKHVSYNIYILTYAYTYGYVLVGRLLKCHLLEGAFRRS